MRGKQGQATRLEDKQDARRRVPAPATPLAQVLDDSIAASPERRLGRLSEVARRHERYSTGSPPFASTSERVQQRQASRDHLSQGLRNQHRAQHAMARRTFERLQRELQRDGRYLASAGFAEEYSNWNAYFHTGSAMDGHTFQRFTFWHTRVTREARSTERVQSVRARRPEWRTLREMLRVCEATATEPPAPRDAAPEVRTDAPPILSIGAGVARSKVGRPMLWITRWILRLGPTR